MANRDFKPSKFLDALNGIWVAFVAFAILGVVFLIPAVIANALGLGWIWASLLGLLAVVIFLNTNW